MLVVVRIDRLRAKLDSSQLCSSRAELKTRWNRQKAHQATGPGSMLPRLVDLPSLLNARLASIAVTSAQMTSMPFAIISLLLSPWHSVPTCSQQLYHHEPQSRSLGTNHKKTTRDECIASHTSLLFPGALTSPAIQARTPGQQDTSPG